MIKSMTGFGRGEYLDAQHRFTVEIKAVNHRFNDIFLRQPKALGALEDRVRKSISGALARGRIEVAITSDDYMEKERIVRVDKGLAAAYFNAVKDIGATCGLDVKQVSAYDIAKFPDVLKIEEKTEDLDALWPKLLEAIEEALGNLTEMRITEGKNIKRDLLARIERIRSVADHLTDRAPQIVEEYREKLRERCREILSEVGALPDESRLLQEVAIMADRSNFTEELVRMNSHLDQFRDILEEGGAVGRKLDFLLQELNRETNTIGSKAGDLATSSVIIDMKSEIEKVREQIQNIE
jgi:uncharacterized protein (TIGR00255 family)